MVDNKNFKFLQGAVIGAILGTAAGMFINSKKGKEMTEDIKDIMADFYKSVSPKIKKLGKLTEKEYKEFIKSAAEKYSKAKEISEDKAKELMDGAQKSWKHFYKHFGK
jgi:gas vesicle protein